MHAAVRAAFVAHTAPLEGMLPYLYCDTLGLVTTGLGNLVDPLQGALALPFRYKKVPAGAAHPWASEGAITAEWFAVKDTDATMWAKGGRAYESMTNLYLDQADIDTLAYQKLDSNDSALAKTFPAWVSWPADAQLAVHSMAWNMGPSFPGKWPDLTTHLKAGDWGWAAEHCLINGKPSLRNRLNRILFWQAACTDKFGRGVNILFGQDPALVTAALLAAAEQPTVPSVAAWWAQVMLQITGHYTAPLDGQFGKVSRTALSAFGADRNLARTINLQTLTALSAATVRIDVVP